MTEKNILDVCLINEVGKACPCKYDANELNATGKEVAVESTEFFNEDVRLFVSTRSQDLSFWQKLRARSGRGQERVRSCRPG